MISNCSSEKGFLIKAYSRSFLSVTNSSFNRNVILNHSGLIGIFQYAFVHIFQTYFIKNYANVDGSLIFIMTSLLFNVLEVFTKIIFLHFFNKKFKDCYFLENFSTKKMLFFSSSRINLLDMHFISNNAGIIQKYFSVSIVSDFYVENHTCSLGKTMKICMFELNSNSQMKVS